MRLKIYSEIDRLKSVMIHRPGIAIDIMSPNLMHELLFDDIIFNPDARSEHDVFKSVLERFVEEVFDIQDLFCETLKIKKAKDYFLDKALSLYKLPKKQEKEFKKLTGNEMAQRVIDGWLDSKNITNSRFFISPLPNLLFMRDPSFIAGNNVVVSNMATKTRKPEANILDTVLRFHPKFKIKDKKIIKLDMQYSEYDFSIEGGDVLILSSDVVAIGVSQRTTLFAIHVLAEKLKKQTKFKTILAVIMPNNRKFMHLDTIFTRIDEEHCILFPPLLDENQRKLLVLRIDISGKEIRTSFKEGLLTALADEGITLKPIFCGGNERIMQEREQWTDGANAVCLAPGVILVYAHNKETNRQLKSHGYKILFAKTVLKKGIDVFDGNRYLIAIKGNELCRARGGPRCMTMPLMRG